MYKVTCSRCGNECEVPFKPSSGKPVFCSKCFEDSGNSDARRPRGKDSRSSNFDNKQMYDAVCDNCGNNCKVPFRPSGGKPVYCSNCFKDKNDRGGKNADQYKEQFEALNAKLDKILKMLTPVVSPEVAQEEKTVEKIEEPKPKKRTGKTEKKKTVVNKESSTQKE
ncbi:MAG TPA: CxxC-x17-CxxC domain-containing protein [Candidatus Bathyarchaeia archaeon]|nr:CxxC-x17-CxxC domain-containing protein [Candidatus Bathyarchaeia archaeon]